jgi:hypothetical protein
MLRIILGAVAGFIVWSILWGGSDTLLKIVSPDWWGKNLQGMEDFYNNKQPYTADMTILILSLVRSFICSIISGFVAARIARENTKSPLLLGVMLLAFGIFVQTLFWNVIPLWYHITFLILLIPVTVLGGKLAGR